MMTTKEVIGRNIKKYRKAAGHTQQELGNKIGYSDSGISAFENGVNEVDMETLKKIADIYGVTVDDLLGDTTTPDFTISNLSITKSNINDALDMLFPLVSNDSAIQNNSFKTAYYKHRKLYDQIKKGTGIVTEDLFKCYDIYVDAWNESGIIEAVVNMVGILFVVCSHITHYDAIKLQQKLNTFHKLESRQAKELFDRTEKGIEDLASEKALFAEDFNSAKVECLRELKKSSEWAQLADYYIAYSYIANFTQNDNSIPQNIKMGRLLMEDYAELGNPLYNKVNTQNGEKYGIIEITLWIGSFPSEVQGTIGFCRLQPRSQMRKLISWITREGRCFISSKDTRLRFVGTQ